MVCRAAPPPKCQADTTGQALKTGCDRGQLLGILSARVHGEPDGKAVPGQDDGLVHVRNAAGQIVEKPAEFAAYGHLLQAVPSRPVSRC
jgi:hypothetical protein